MRKHVQHGCERPDTCGGTCHGCCLAWCSVCGRGEIQLTTECPGEVRSDLMPDEGWDFVDGAWAYVGSPAGLRPQFAEDKP